MKRAGIFLLTMALLLTLGACGGEQTAVDLSDNKDNFRTVKENQGNENQQSAEKQTDSESTEDQNPKEYDWNFMESGNEPYGKYLTESEWEAIILGEADYENTPIPIRFAPLDPIIVEEKSGAAYTGEGKTVLFEESNVTDGEVGYFDWKSHMTEEELAEWEAFDPNDPEIQALLEQSDEATRQLEEAQNEMPDVDMDAIQQQIDEAMKEAKEELENLELPEGVDLDELMGGFFE